MVNWAQTHIASSYHSQRKLRIIFKHIIKSTLQVTADNSVTREQCLQLKKGIPSEIKKAFQKLHLTIDKLHHGVDGSDVYETTLEGEHKSSWQGATATYYPISIPMWFAYTKNADDSLSLQNVYYDG